MEKSAQERATDIDEQIAMLKEKKKELLRRDRAKARKERTHRLVTCGAIIENAFGMEIVPDVLAMYLGAYIRKDENGNGITVGQAQAEYYRRALARYEEGSH